MASRSWSIIRSELQAYVDRGLLREFVEKPGRAGRYECQFRWLTPRPLVLQYETSTATLTIKNLLPNVSRSSAMTAEMVAFVAGRSAADLPAHRRIDPARINVRWLAGGRNMSLAIRVKRREYAYAVNKVFNLVNEILALLRRSYAPYMEEQFGISKE